MVLVQRLKLFLMALLFPPTSAVIEPNCLCDMLLNLNPIPVKLMNNPRMWFVISLWNSDLIPAINILFFFRGVSMSLSLKHNSALNLCSYWANVISPCLRYRKLLNSWVFPASRINYASNTSLNRAYENSSSWTFTVTESYQSMAALINWHEAKRLLILSSILRSTKILSHV